jgi:uncharacterized protein YjiS (DUF1127 family)
MPARLLRPSAQQGARRPAAAAFRLAAALVAASLHIADTLLLWQERVRQRRALGTLSDHMLKDLGLSRVDAGLESGKRFWQD